jgi:hypothetical protein
MKTKSTLFSVLLLSAFACRKELPQLPERETPVFFTEMTSPALNVTLKAGENSIVFSEEIQIQNQVKVYSGILQNADTLFRVNFYAGEVFKALNATSFMGLSTILPVSLPSSTLAQLSPVDLSNSQFDNINFTVNQGDLVESIEVQGPGLYTFGVSAQRNGMNYESANLAVIGYDNPYKFELVGSINSSGPGIILEGLIQNLTENIEKIEWTCGSNSQTTTGTEIQFPPAGSNNLLTAKVTFADGVTRIRTIGLGFENAPKIEDLVYHLESSNDITFSNKVEIILETNGQSYTSLFATTFSEGNPVLTISEKTFYTDPVTKQQALLIAANGLIYFKNTQNNETIPVQINLNIGLPISF